MVGPFRAVKHALFIRSVYFLVWLDCLTHWFILLWTKWKLLQREDEFCSLSPIDSLTELIVEEDRRKYLLSLLFLYHLYVSPVFSI